MQGINLIFKVNNDRNILNKYISEINSSSIGKTIKNFNIEKKTNKIIKINFEKKILKTNIQRMNYKIDNSQNKIKILGEYFIQFNKQKCRIIKNNKIYILKSYINKTNNDINNIKIKLKIIDLIQHYFVFKNPFFVNLFIRIIEEYHPSK